MLRLKPTSISLTMSEVKDVESRFQNRRCIQAREISEDLRERARESGGKHYVLRAAKQSSSTSTVIDHASITETDPLEGYARSEDILLSPGLSFLSRPPRRIPRLEKLEMANIETSMDLRDSSHSPILDAASDTSPRSTPRPDTEDSEQLVQTVSLEEMLSIFSSSKAGVLSGLHPTEARGLSLPPPFSLRARDVSLAHARTQPHAKDELEKEDAYPRERPSRVDFAPTTPVRHSSLRATSEVFIPGGNSSFGHTSDIRAAINLVGSNVRPSGQASFLRGDESPPEPRTARSGGRSRPSPTPASSGIRVYNDLLPPSSQPQTPLNLPEARHQSRLRGAFTAPIRSISPLFGRTLMHSGRRSRRRSPSPIGLQGRGFQGLYGGVENGDDSLLFAESMRRREQEGSE